MSFEHFGQGSDADRSFEKGRFFTGDVWVDPGKGMYEALFKRKGLFKCVRGARAGRVVAGWWRRAVSACRECIRALPSTTPCTPLLLPPAPAPSCCSGFYGLTDMSKERYATVKERGVTGNFSGDGTRSEWGRRKRKVGGA
jgi:hypothetical protein